MRLEDILSNLLTVVAGIDGSGSYENRVKHASRDFVPAESLNSSDFPSVFVNLVSSDTQLLTKQRVRDEPEVEMTLVVLAQKDLSTALTSLIGDVYRAVMADPSRGGLALFTQKTGVPSVDETSLAPRGIAVAKVRFRVLYEHALGDMD